MRSSINNPPYFDGNNYPHWKAYIEFFLRKQREQVQNMVRFNWGSSLKLDRIGRSIDELKSK